MARVKPGAEPTCSLAGAAGAAAGRVGVTPPAVEAAEPTTGGRAGPPADGGVGFPHPMIRRSSEAVAWKRIEPMGQSMIIEKVRFAAPDAASLTRATKP